MAPWHVAVPGFRRVARACRTSTVHAQCTHSARPQCTSSKRCKYHRKWPLHIKTKKKLVSVFFNDCMPFQRITCYLHHLVRVHCGVHCGVHCACTVKTHASVYSAPSSASSCPSIHCFPLGELACPLEHSCEPWCFAAACALASLCARWNTLVSLGALPLHAPWQACVPVGTLL